MTALLALRAGLIALGSAAIGIGASIFFFGAQATGSTAANLAALLFGSDPSPPELSGADIDSELRFYAVFWFVYGVFVLSAARGLPQRMRRAQMLLALFFAGGVGRALSFAALDAPHDLFIVPMWVELTLPVALGALSFAVGARRQT